MFIDLQKKLRYRLNGQGVTGNRISQPQGKEDKKMKIIVLAHKGGHLISAECESGKEALDAAHELISKGYKLDGHQAIK